MPPAAVMVTGSDATPAFVPRTDFATAAANPHPQYATVVTLAALSGSLALKQDQLTPGPGITLVSNTISATGGGGFPMEGNGIALNNPSENAFYLSVGGVPQIEARNGSLLLTNYDENASIDFDNSNITLAGVYKISLNVSGSYSDIVLNIGDAAVAFVHEFNMETGDREPVFDFQGVRVANLPEPRVGGEAANKAYADKATSWEEIVEGDYIERYGNYFVSGSYGGVCFYAIGLPGTGTGTIKVLNTAGMYITIGIAYFDTVD
jgi:hypothetical protein